MWNGNFKYSADYFSMQFSTILKDWNVLSCFPVDKNNMLFIIWYSINAVKFIWLIYILKIYSAYARVPSAERINKLCLCYELPGSVKRMFICRRPAALHNVFHSADSRYCFMCFNLSEVNLSSNHSSFVSWLCNTWTADLYPDFFFFNFLMKNWIKCNSRYLFEGC